MKKFSSGGAILSAIFVFALVILTQVSMGGSLEPSALPAPTMKTLTEIEPRIALHQSDVPITISKGGSYYLAENITVTTLNVNGITITDSNVTIDLCGFVLSGQGKLNQSGGYGIYSGTAGSSNQNIKILNGTVRNWRWGGIYLSGRNNSVDNVRCMATGDMGLYMFSGSRAAHCVFADNYMSGCIAAENCVISDSTAYNNTGYGFSISNGSTITNCTSSGHTGNNNYGIYANNSTIIGCSVYQNGYGIYSNGGCTIKNCTAYNNGSTNAGIWANNNTLIIECMVYNNAGDGIRVLNNCQVTGCNSTGNGVVSSSGSGILVAGSRNRIEGNNCVSNKYGIYVTAAGNMIIKNSASSNNTNYSIAASNNYGSIIISPGASFVSGTPWSNFEF